MSDLTRGQDNDAGELPGLYVHVPFCSKTCDFCGFYQTRPTADSIGRFLSGVETELRLTGWSGGFETVFWGGGTPGLLPPSAIGRLGRAIGEVLGGKQPAEWSVEMAPASVTSDRLMALIDIGVTRVSLGVQSFSPKLLEAIGRPHTVAQAERAHDRIRAANFKSVNLDLMFALPGQSEEARREDVARAIALEPDHLSTYCLTFEEDTALWTKLSQGRVRLDPENEARHYEATWRQLAAAGYEQYEVSNFARPGHRCRHNLNTWRMGSWIGVGPSAASQHSGWRGTNVADLDRWTEGLAAGRRADCDRIAVTPEVLAQDALVFGLRMNDGVEPDRWRRSCPEAPWKAIDALLERLVRDGLATNENGCVRLTDTGRLVADAIGVEVLGAFSEEAVSS